MPGGSMAGYNDGRTLTHEAGHFFFLFHIWGDDDGACNGSDGVSDTPNQSDASSGCHSGVLTDACSTTAPGIMYQNYMDYSSDGCMSMFTLLQVDAHGSSTEQLPLIAHYVQCSCIAAEGCRCTGAEYR